MMGLVIIALLPGIRGMNSTYIHNCTERAWLRHLFFGSYLWPRGIPGTVGDGVCVLTPNPQFFFLMGSADLQ